MHIYQYHIYIVANRFIHKDGTDAAGRVFWTLFLRVQAIPRERDIPDNSIPIRPCLGGVSPADAKHLS